MSSHRFPRVVALLVALAMPLGMGPMSVAGAAPPDNDDFADAVEFELDDTGPLTGTNVDATREDGEPSHHGVSGSASVWWRFTADEAMTVALSTQGSDFDTVLAVYTGTVVDDLDEIASNDDHDGLTSLVQFDVTAGTTYHVAVDGYSSDMGDIVLSWGEGDVEDPDPDVGTDPALVVEGPDGNEGPVDFGAVPVGQSIQRTLRVRNTGGGPLVIQDLRIEARSFAQGEYGVASDQATGATIPPGEHREVVLEYAPQTGWTAAPHPVPDDELLAGQGRITLRYIYSGAALSGFGVYAYLHNAGGSGTVSYTATVRTGDAVNDQQQGTTALVGGDAYSMEIVTGLSGSASQSSAQFDIPPDFTHTQGLEPGIGSSSVPAFNSVDDVIFHRLEDAYLIVRSNDPNTQGDEIDPAGTFVQLFGASEGEGTPAPPPTPPLPTGDVDRWAGDDRFSTAAAVSAAAFPTGADVAFVATGANFPDALAGGPAAIQAEGPILLTSRDSLPQPTIDELQRLSPDRIVVLGGPGAVSEAVATQLGQHAPMGVSRLSGADRFATAAAVSAATFPQAAQTAFIATGANFPDALAGGPPAGLRGGPILLTGRDSLPQATIDELARLQPQDIVVLGGTGVVSSAVEAQLAAYAGGEVQRWACVNRFNTAALVSAAAFPGGADVVFVATGANFPDALAGGPPAGMNIGPILLTERDSLPQATIDELQRIRPERIVILGGPGVVSQAVATQLASYVQ